MLMFMFKVQIKRVVLSFKFKIFVQVLRLQINTKVLILTVNIYCHYFILWFTDRDKRDGLRFKFNIKV
jgi:hypothetical protein